MCTILLSHSGQWPPEVGPCLVICPLQQIAVSGAEGGGAGSMVTGQGEAERGEKMGEAKESRTGGTDD